MDYDYSKLGLSDEELFSHIETSELDSEKITAPRYSYWRSVFRVFFRNKVNIFIMILLAVIFAFSYIYPAFIGYDRYANLMNAGAKHLAPKAAMETLGKNIHWILGSGASGQSTFDSIWYGSRISISMALICAAINTTLGVIVGAVWGFSKKLDVVMQEIYNIIGNVPYILTVTVLLMIFKPTFWTMVLAMTVTDWIALAYFIRTQVIIIRDREYNLASKCLGTSTIKIAMKNILPFMTSIIVTLIAEIIPSYISMEVYLAYIGVRISDTTLGVLIGQAESAMVTPGWEFEFWSPVVVSAIIAVVLYVAGQNLGDASDPRTHMD